ncbi:MAG: thioredoxin domain-containing protein [Patescibacteria group bacterium]|nr:thioredoxin domain-containing protein [Patescibacteria group bacterium]
METKKTVRVIFIFILAALAVFGLILFFNNHIEEKQDLLEASEMKTESELSGNQQSYAAANFPVISEDDFVSGNGNSLDIIVYEDYGDVFSADFADVLKQARAEFGDRVRLAYRPFNFSHTDLSDEAAQAVGCAFTQGKGEEFRDMLFQSVHANQLNAEKLNSLAGEIGLNQEDFQGCLTNPEKKERIGKLSLDAGNFSVYGAPTVFVGDEMIVGARPYEAFVDSNGDEIEGLKQVIERQLK